MSHKIHYLVILVLLIIVPPVTAQTETPQPPAFHLWFDCVERGEYGGQAYAAISYRYDGSDEVTAEDYRLFGDDFDGESRALTIEPGEHLRVHRFNVGANKIVVLKVILYGKLHVVTLSDHSEFLDCPLDEIPLATPDPTFGTTGSV